MQRAKCEIQVKKFLIYLDNNFINDEISLVMSRCNKRDFLNLSSFF